MSEWPQPYHDIPADDYLTSKDFLLSNGYPLDYVPKLNELIGPHERRYMNLMRHFRKPICLLDTSHLPYWTEEIAWRKYGVIPVSEDEVIVHLPKEKDRALKLIGLIISHRVEKGIDYHVKFGYLLGYTLTCIEAFYTRIQYILQGDKQMADSDIFKSVEKFKQAKMTGVITDLSTLIEEIIHDTNTEKCGSR